MKPQQPDTKLVRLPGRDTWHLRYQFPDGDWSTSSFCGVYLDYFGSMTWNAEEEGPFVGKVCKKCAAQSLAWREQHETNPS